MLRPCKSNPVKKIRSWVNDPLQPLGERRTHAMYRILEAYDLNLPCLRLNNFRLSSIPAELGQLSALQRLDLSYNKLIFIPPELGNLVSLEELYLNNNCLTSVPEEIAGLLTLIDAGGNYFDEYYFGVNIYLEDNLKGQLALNVDLNWFTKWISEINKPCYKYTILRSTVLRGHGTYHQEKKRRDYEKHIKMSGDFINTAIEMITVFKDNIRKYRTDIHVDADIQASCPEAA